MASGSAWALVKIRHRLSLSFIAVSLVILLLGAVLSGLLQNPGFANAKFLPALPVVPIFAAVNERDDHVIFVNETDLGYRAQRPFPLPDEQMAGKAIVKPNAPATIPLNQPDAHERRETTRAEISLDLAAVSAALVAGRDYARVNNYHEKQVFELADGEQAAWVSVPHFRKYLRYNSGLVYTLREGRPVILFQLSAAHEFFLHDFDQDGFLDIARVVDKAFAWTHWEVYRYDAELGYFQPSPSSWHWFPLRYTVQQIKVLVSLAMPLIFAITLAAWMRRHWLTITVNVFVQFYLLLVVLSLGMGGMMNFFPLTWAVAMSALLIGMMNLSRGLVKKHAAATEDQASPPG